jgi:hypothetical protein
LGRFAQETGIQTTQVDGCQYLGCEDSASNEVTLADDEIMVEVRMCTMHAAFVSRRRSERRLVVPDPEPLDRVRVLLVPTDPESSSKPMA